MADKTDVRKFMAVASKPHAEIAGMLADEIKAAIFKYEGQIPLALAVGVLRIVEKELLDDAERRRSAAAPLGDVRCIGWFDFTGEQMSAPKFEFMANNAEPDDKSGVALWRYTVQQRGMDVDQIVRQSFDTFDAAKGINDLVRAAWMDGEAEGFALCERGVLDALRRYK